MRSLCIPYTPPYAIPIAHPGVYLFVGERDKATSVDEDLYAFAVPGPVMLWVLVDIAVIMHWSREQKGASLLTDLPEGTHRVIEMFKCFGTDIDIHEGDLRDRLIDRALVVVTGREVAKNRGSREDGGGGNSRGYRRVSTGEIGDLPEDTVLPCEPNRLIDPVNVILPEVVAMRSCIDLRKLLIRIRRSVPMDVHDPPLGAYSQAQLQSQHSHSQTHLFTITPEDIRIFQFQPMPEESRLVVPIEALADEALCRAPDGERLEGEVVRPLAVDMLKDSALPHLGPDLGPEEVLLDHVV